MSSRRLKRHEIDQRHELEEFIAERRPLDRWVIQGIDLAGLDFSEIDVNETLFIGCTFENPAQREALVARGAQFLVQFPDLPFEPYRSELYSVAELLTGYDEHGYVGTRDFKIYEHFDRERHHECGISIRAALAQRLHDQGVEDALEEIIEGYRGRGVVGVMGGHGTPRNDASYRDVALTTWDLTRRGYLVASGGGPGIMEAANLGAFLAPYADSSVVDAAIEILSEAPKFDGGHAEGSREYLDAIRQYIAVAKRVSSRFFGDHSSDLIAEYQRETDVPGISLAIPTWFYGHEPTNLFGNFVAKFFSNSLREDGLLAIADAGVIYAPGSAGTLQEVFMDLAQNHYATFKVRSPMVFLGTDAFASTYGLIREFIDAKGVGHVYGDLVTLVDTPEDAAEFIAEHPPRPRKVSPPLYELV